VTADLGVFTAGELRAGGFNQHGFLQPMLPIPDGVDVRLEADTAAEGLASRGLLVRREAGWLPIGRYQRVLEAAAVARVLLAVGPASPRAAGFATPRLVLGCLGTTNEVLDLQLVGDGYHARLLDVAEATAELAESLGAGESAPVGDGAPAGEAAPVGDDRPAVSDQDPGWSWVEALLTAGVATVRVEAASISNPAAPLLQHRLTLLATTDGPWLLLGTREGAQFSRVAAGAAPWRVRGLIGSLLRGTAAAAAV
jgi:hypothetical protein